MSSTTIPLADAGPLWLARNRTRILRIVLGLALAATVAAAFFASRSGKTSTTPFLGSASRGIVVLDLSASIENLTLDRMYEALTALSRSGGRYGLVVFSDQAYEALPPGTPATELADYAAFFRRVAKHGGGDLGPSRVPVVVYPTNPWSSGFSLGTQISSGLDLARSLILARHVSARDVYLVSDLDDNEADLPLVTQSAQTYVQSHIALHVVALNPEKKYVDFFRALPSTTAGGVAVNIGANSKTTHHAFPIALATLGVLLALLLAANELWSTPVEWSPSPA